MKEKIFCLILSIFILSSISLQGKSKPPAIPLSELTDPSSPSYVPYPYPKTEAEILEDLKHAIRRDIENSNKYQSAFVSKKAEDEAMKADHLVRGLIEEEPRLFIKDIFKVVDLQANSSDNFYYLIILIDKEQRIKCVGKVNDCGIWGGFMFTNEEHVFQSYPNREKATAIYQSKVNDRIINNMKFVYLVSTISSVFNPLWRIETDNGTFFIDYKGENLYELKGESVPLLEGNTYYLSPEQKKEILLFDDLNDQVRFLKKIE